MAERTITQVNEQSPKKLGSFQRSQKKNIIFNQLCFYKSEKIHARITNEF